MIKNVYWSSCKVPSIFERFKLKLNLLDKFSKITQIPNFMKMYIGLHVKYLLFLNDLN